MRPAGGPAGPTPEPWIAQPHIGTEQGIAIIACDRVDEIIMPTRGMVAWVGFRAEVNWDNAQEPLEREIIEEARANARLIAAAPCAVRLLAKLRAELLALKGPEAREVREADDLLQHVAEGTPRRGAKHPTKGKFT